MQSLAACIVGFKAVGQVVASTAGMLSVSLLGPGVRDAESSPRDIQFLPSLQNWGLEVPGGREGPTVPHGYRSSQGWARPGPQWPGRLSPGCTSPLCMDLRERATQRWPTTGKRCPDRSAGWELRFPACNGAREGSPPLPAPRRFCWEFSLTSEPPPPPRSDPLRPPLGPAPFGERVTSPSPASCFLLPLSLAQRSCHSGARRRSCLLIGGFRLAPTRKGGRGSGGP